MKLNRLRWLNFNANPDDVGGGGGSTAGADPIIDPVVDPVIDPAATNDPAPAWPDDWRQLYAGEDEKKLAHLSRYASPAAAFDGLIATKTKLSSGEYKSAAPFPEKGSEEEQSAWREQNGIPVKPEEYAFENIKDDDKEYIAEFQQYALENNIPASNAKAFIGFLQDQESKLDENDREIDARLQQESEDKLRVEWGQDYRRNLNIITGMFDSAPEGVKDKILSGRLADGTPFGSDVDVSKFLIDLALQVNPVATVVTSSGGNMSATIESELDKINTMMKEDSKKYFADEKIQARWRELTEAKERMAK